MGTIKPSYTTSSMIGVEDQQTTTFRDGSEQWSTTIRSHLDETRDVAMSNQMQLGDFFSRPYKIATFTWDPASVTPFYQTFDPWALFFNNPNVINRLNNYNLLQAKLNVKFMINGNSFYYGRLMVDYIIDPSNDTVSSRSGAILANIIQASQRLHLFIDPCLSQAGTLTLPFIFSSNSLSIPSGEWALNMGSLQVRQMQPLKHANGATTPVNISVFAWASDVKVSQPTSVSSVALVPQAGDEYGTKPVSSVMSTVAKIAGALEVIPWMTPYAKATQMIATGVGKVATIFGFSRPAQIENIVMMRKYVLGNLTNTDRGDTVTKLTVDSKQELSVDPAIFGVDVEDELNIKHIASIESYITQFSWPTSAVATNTLWSARVGPVHSSVDGQFTYNPAVTFAVTPFKFWRGTIRYRFQIVASAFHKGRLLVTYDPVAISSLATNLQYSKIIDLSDERDFVIDVCWSQQRTFLPVPALNSSWYLTTPYTSRSFAHNGVLNVSVLNELTSPNSSVNNNIAINVFASAQDDFEVALPYDKFSTSSYLPPAGVVPQSGDVDGSGPSDQTPEENAPIVTDAKECVGTPIELDHTVDVFFGESIQSFRTLLKRYMLHSTPILPVVANTFFALNDYDFPCYRGYGPDARNVLSGPVQGAVVNTTLLNYITPCFVGYRGSMRSKYFVQPGSSAKGVFAAVAREPDSLSYSLGTSVLSTTSASTFAGSLLNVASNGYSGLEITDVGFQPTVEVELPFYTDKRYFNARTVTRSFLGDQRFLMHSFRYLSPGAGSPIPHVQRYVSVGEDFQLFLFQGQPPFIYQQTLVPV
jgi:hypothetical protein